MGPTYAKALVAPALVYSTSAARTRLTKTDWSVWIATLGGDRADFEVIVAPIHDYLNATTARLPFVDSYVMDDPKSGGMRARPVIGGVFIKMLADPATWKRAGRRRWPGRRRGLGGGERLIPNRVDQLPIVEFACGFRWRSPTRRKITLPHDCV